MIGNCLMKTAAILDLLCCLVEQSEAKPSAMKFKKFRCNYKCMTDFDMCVSLITTMPQYVICYRAQGICKRKCKDHYGDKSTRIARSYQEPESTGSPILKYAKLSHEKVDE